MPMRIFSRTPCLRSVTMSKTNRIEQLDAYIVGDLAFIVEASWMEGFAQDIVLSLIHI